MALNNEQLTVELQQLSVAFHASQSQLAEARNGLATQVAAIDELQRQLASANDALVTRATGLKRPKCAHELAKAYR